MIQTKVAGTSLLSKASLRIKSFKWHLTLAWVAGFALLCYLISGFTHPLMAWTGPQSSAFRPPTAVMQADQLSAVRQVLTRQGIEQAVMAKLIPSKSGVVMQVTENANQARRYFDLKTAAELPGYDQQHARWLARYYALNGDTSVPIKSVEFQTEFDDAYPWVNRLLPVYKVTFENKENLSVFIYTEINALAGISNNYKTRVQSIFRTLHTWSWLSGFENVRIILIGALVLCVFGMTLTGIGMIFLIKRRNNRPMKARAHRWLAIVLWVPLLGFSISGFWHLLHYGFSDVHRGLKLGEPMSLSTLASARDVADLPQQPLNQVSMVAHQDELYYRLSMAKQNLVTQKPKESPKPAAQGGGEHAHHDSNLKQREARFKGQATEQGGLYYNAASGQRATITDKEVAESLASQQLNLDQSSITNTQLVTHFGPHYDFRNKRLPVWQIDFDSPLGDKVFIDPATGILVDRLVDLDRYEGYSFSFLHKWSFLTPFTGRMWRDVIVVIVLSLLFVMTILGLTIRRNRTRTQNKQAT